MANTNIIDLEKEHFNIVIVGHVDHGKSTLVGRLYADTDSLPDGKLDEVKAICEQQGKEFEYAFLFDALLEEQEQGITIDTARTFFQWKEREYILIDAPGHKEFLKNMISGAARAEAALLLIDVHEGVKAQSRQHGYMLSLLGIKQVTVVLNKMDLVNYDQAVYDRVVAEYSDFLKELNVVPMAYIPVSAREGDNIANKSSNMGWYEGGTVLDMLSEFQKESAKSEKPLRFPVQDVYKFDARRIISGRIASGKINVGDHIVFSPSNKTAVVKSIEAFNVPSLPQSAIAGESIGITLDEQLFIERGEIISHPKKAPVLSSAFRCNIFWMGRKPLVTGKKYVLRLTSQEVECEVAEIHKIIDSTNLESAEKEEKLIERNGVAEITIRTKKPIAFDLYKDFDSTGRFVLVDGYDVNGGGIIMHAVHEEEEILLEVARRRDFSWVKGEVALADRAFRFGHREGLVLFTGEDNSRKADFARSLEKDLFKRGRNAYLLDGSNLRFGIDADISDDDGREVIRRFGETAHLMLQAGMILVSTTNAFAPADHQSIRTLVHPSPAVLVHIAYKEGESTPANTDIEISIDDDREEALQRVIEKMREKGVFF